MIVSISHLPTPLKTLGSPSLQCPPSYPFMLLKKVNSPASPISVAQMCMWAEPSTGV